MTGVLLHDLVITQGFGNSLPVSEAELRDSERERTKHLLEI